MCSLKPELAQKRRLYMIADLISLSALVYLPYEIDPP